MDRERSVDRLRDQGASRFLTWRRWVSLPSLMSRRAFNSPTRSIGVPTLIIPLWDRGEQLAQELIVRFPRTDLQAGKSLACLLAYLDGRCHGRLLRAYSPDYINPARRRLAG